MKDLEGWEDIDKAFKKLGNEIAGKALKKCMRRAEKIELEQAKENCRTMIGGEMGDKIADALKVATPRGKKKDKEHTIATMIDPKRADEFRDGEAYIPAAIEFGHKDRAGKDVPPIPALYHAAEDTADERIKATARELKKEIEKLGKQ